MRIWFFIFLALASVVQGCRKVPPVRSAGGKIPGDNNYRVLIGNDPEGYEPGKIYNLFLLGSRNYNRLQQFTHFMLTIKASSTDKQSTARFTEASPKRVGRFQLFGDSLAEFNEECVNTVSEADDFPKSEIQVMWVAPPKGSGCVAISAMVFEDRNKWYSDDGGLTKIICEQKVELKTECCACDEAKYNLVFEGIWSNVTHPKDYPFAVWLTHFSDVIGASHESNFSFWGENHIATDGFRSLAEWGSARLLEVELRAKGSKLRTLIKAAGLWYPDVNTNTSSQFRVDRKHPKISVVSMFGPSPDWVVGVNGLNLCQEDCSWKDSLDIDLYPWDAGTDNGITYMSPNAETQPRERMFKITNMYPEDPRAPFYNPKSDKMPPLAKLYLRKVKNIPKGCDEEVLQAQLDVSENSEDEVRAECETSEYTQWSPCSVTCGKGLRMRNRQYLKPDVASQANCNRQLIFKEMCVANIPECEVDSSSEDNELSVGSATVDDAGEGVGVCRTTLWSPWSECSTTCGIGISMRTRTFIDNMGRKKCPHISVVEKQKCMLPECSVADIEMPDPMCPVTQWSDWSPCSTTCGKGVKIRTRLFTGDESKKTECERRLVLNEQRECSDRAECFFDAEEAKEICILSAETGPCRGSFPRFGYDISEGRCKQFLYGGCRGNKNNFVSNDDCMRTCRHIKRQNQQEVESGTPIDCILSDWTPWTQCSVSCGNGMSEKYRNIVREAQNGGNACPKRVVKKKRCVMPAC